MAQHDHPTEHDQLISEAVAIQQAKLQATRAEQAAIGAAGSGTSSGQPEPIANAVERWRERFDEIRRRNAEREAQERAAFTGDCFACRDRGPCAHCERGRAVQEQMERDERAARIRQVMSDSGFPERFQSLTFGSFPGPTPENLRSFLRGWDGKRNLLLVGKYGCVAGETIVQGPDGDERIDVLEQRGKPIQVWALDETGPVAAWATAPFRKGITDLYRVELASGKSIVTTLNHRFLTASGWRVLAQLGVGSRLVCSSSRRVSIEGLSRTTFPEGGRNFGDRPADFHGSCFGDCRRGGGLLRDVRGSDRELVPSRVGVLEHSYSDGDGDDLAHTRECSRPHPLAARHSRSDCAPLLAHPASGAEFRSSASRYRPLFLQREVDQQFRQWSDRPDTTGEFDQLGDLRGLACVTPSAELYHDTITVIAYERTDIYYDLHVPGLENYLANGIWNHNTGKTGLLAASVNVMAPQFVEYRRTVRFTSTVSLFDELRSGYDDGSFDQVMRRCQRAGLLILDDLGAEKPSEWVRERLFAIVDHRYGRELPIWSTSNLDPDRLMAVVGERVFWRFIENCDVLEIDGPNLRERAS